jgi:hypothetical protein
MFDTGAKNQQMGRKGGMLGGGGGGATMGLPKQMPWGILKSSQSHLQKQQPTKLPDTMKYRYK